MIQVKDIYVNNNQKSAYSIVVPVFNEENNIEFFYKELINICNSDDLKNFTLIFVNDGSVDNTAQKIKDIIEKDKRVKLISFISNYGHQQAISAGLKFFNGDFVIIMDGDLQHPIKTIPELIDKYTKGFDVVNTRRTENQTGILKNLFSNSFYPVFNKISGIKIEYNSSDFRLISKRVVELLNEIPEKNKFFRALIPTLGFPASVVNFEPDKRKIGIPSFTMKRSLKMALNAIFNYSTEIINMILLFGFLLLAISLSAGFYLTILKILSKDYWAIGNIDLLAALCIIGSINIIIFGIIGKYLEVIIQNVRPRKEYIIDYIIDNNN